jgi:hypothetical protein
MGAALGMPEVPVNSSLPMTSTTVALGFPVPHSVTELEPNFPLDTDWLSGPVNILASTFYFSQRQHKFTCKFICVVIYLIQIRHQSKITVGSPSGPSESDGGEGEKESGVTLIVSSIGAGVGAFLVVSMVAYLAGKFGIKVTHQLLIV